MRAVLRNTRVNILKLYTTVSRFNRNRVESYEKSEIERTKTKIAIADNITITMFFEFSNNNSTDGLSSHYENCRAK